MTVKLILEFLVLLGALLLGARAGGVGLGLWGAVGLLVLVVALILGRWGRIGPLSWHIPLSANLTLRNFGLTLFLAAVGLSSGAPFVETVTRTGFTFIGIGAASVLGAILSILVLGHYLFRLSTDDLFGVVSGAAGKPAILAYATIFPSMTILKIICAQVASSSPSCLT